MAQPVKRHLFQGVWTIIRFNWHLHAVAIASIALLLAGAVFLSGLQAVVCGFLAMTATSCVLLSLIATWHAYDASGLYQMSWLASGIGQVRSAGNIHAGFDETTAILRSAFPDVSWRVFDFYDSSKHTEISIRRARKAHPPPQDAIAIRTDHIPLPDSSLDLALLMLAAHEIRDHHERVTFFRELKRVIAPGGSVIVTEHLRDPANIAAYTIGAWHFHSRTEWLSTFHEGGFLVFREFRNNLLITTFILKPDANTP
jgi:SAM-dependent methyltransferase